MPTCPLHTSSSNWTLHLIQLTLHLRAAPDPDHEETQICIVETPPRPQIKVFGAPGDLPALNNPDSVSNPKPCSETPNSLTKDLPVSDQWDPKSKSPQIPNTPAMITTSHLTQSCPSSLPYRGAPQPFSTVSK